MRVLFCYPNIATRTKPEIHLGIGYMSSLLKRRGHHVSLYWPQSLSRSSLETALRAGLPDLVAFSATSHQLEYALQLCRWTREIAPSSRIIFGGVHPTLDPEGTIACEGVEMLCRGEGEKAMLALGDQLNDGREPGGIPNLWIKRPDGTVEKNDIGLLLDDLDFLPIPDRELFDIRRVIADNGYRFEFLSGRGCPFNCTYCCNHAIKELCRGKGPYVRKRSVANLLEEIRYVKTNYPVRSILFHDDTFTLNRRWLFDFCTRYGGEFRIPFHCLARVETIDGEVADALRAAGCRAVSLGVESGSERIRRQVLKRDISDEQIRGAFSTLRERGIKRFSFNMLGLPGETPADIEKTIALNKKIDPDWMGVLVFTPYPGTELYRLCEERGYLVSRRFQPNYLTEKSIALKLPSITRRQLVRKYRKFQAMAYGKYIRQNYPRLYPFFVILSPLLRTPLHNAVSAVAYKLLYKK